MNYDVLIVAIFSGIIGGLVGLITYKNNRNKKEAEIKKGNTKLRIFSVVLIIGFSQAIILNKDLKIKLIGLFDKETAKIENLKLRFNSFLDIPEVKEKLKTFNTEAEAKTYAQLLVRRGLKRLPQADLYKWNEVRIKLMEISPLVCGGLWTGVIDERELYRTIASLDEKSITFWIEMSKKAATLEIAKSDFLATDQNDFVKAFNGIKKFETPENQIKMEQLVARGNQVSTEEGCWIMGILLRNVSKLDKQVSDRFLRYLASL